MTTIEPVKPTNAKAWISTIGGLIGAAVPFIAQFAGYLPEPWGAIVGGIIGVIALATGGATYQKSNVPEGAVVGLPVSPAPTQEPTPPPPPPVSGHTNPWT